MLKRVDILVEADLLQGVIDKFHLLDAREAVHLALKAVLDEGPEVEHDPQDEDYDEFSDLSAWQLHRNGDSG
ncbi:type II toxin-antitoxin system VapB family antitoxin [Mycobacterium asiaticum]|uniref:Antitoxin VapB n=1 Tax=Mycobacterium asiaticum TaxID=1790 RepID=A0A1A3CPZ5_MYCAS|nr:type II toxin-antitoxin system VapB family antitoxin [Mycobacterium asiaticum]OBI88016.1 hypothetical protein A5661_07035 [Mycobacterium asiaticum]OBJ51734.1 hypothetical protein A9W94_25560 [Mycobacterium asiaticum]OBJ83699.1 hypothetical protein A5640_17735 [Mycobacterium asiaticum]ORA17863.1 hypothetical protein BST16_03095 [Mycobacterium asiaticum DSM 44297]